MVYHYEKMYGTFLNLKNNSKKLKQQITFQKIFLNSFQPKHMCKTPELQELLPFSSEII